MLILIGIVDNDDKPNDNSNDSNNICMYIYR